MYCDKCGNRLMGYEKYCSNCGHMIGNNDDNNENKVTDNYNNKSTDGSRSTSIILGGLSLGGVFLGIFAPVSLILSIIGFVLAIRANKNANNTIGIVLNGISLFLSVIITAFIALVIYFMII